ncbi:MAG: hypothetical protein JRG95_11835 [Deltaproteobacteria bacterium]|nr:hypothetical protein [Deltaproteobacteria bacterium]
MRFIPLVTLLLALILGISLPAAAQDLGDRIEKAKDKIDDIRNDDDSDSDSDEKDDEDSDSDKDDEDSDSDSDEDKKD